MFEIIDEMFGIQFRKVNLYEFSKDGKYYQVRTYYHQDHYDAELYEVRYKIVNNNPHRHFNYRFIDRLDGYANEEQTVRELLAGTFHG